LGNYILAIDIGTTSTKGLAVASGGKVLSIHQEYYPTHYPHPGHAEQNPEEIWQAVISVIRKVSSEALTSGKLTGLSFSCAMHSVMAVSLNGEALSSLIIWADSRSTREAKALKNSAAGKLLHQQTGTPIHPMSPLCKLLWWKRSDQQFNTAHKFISIKEFVIYRLTGEFVVDYSVASASGLFNIHSRTWHTEALTLAGITDKQLSQPVSPYYTLSLLKEAREILSLPDVPLVMGASDGCLAQLGSHALGDHDLTISIGTSAAVRRAVKEVKEDVHNRLFNYLLDEAVFVSGGASNNGTAVVDWFNQSLGTPHQPLDSFVKEALTSPAGCEGLLALPYLSGERAPIYNPEARGVFFGVSMRHRQEHFKRAILESICFEIVSLIDSVEEVHGASKKIIVSGGFTHAPGWVQLLSDITGRELQVTEMNDASTLGAAMMGFKALGIAYRKSKADVKVVQPEMAHAAIYKKNSEKFGLLYSQLLPLFGD
jgi:gluconokinase